MYTLAFILSLLATTFVVGGNAAAVNGTNGTNTDVPSPVKIVCNIPGYAAARNNADVVDGIQYLELLQGNATLGHQGGGGWCWRYSCSYDTGIYGCNDAQNDVQVPWASMGSYASDITNKCGLANKGKVQGQAFSPDGWNVIVGLKNGESC